MSNLAFSTSAVNSTWLINPRNSILFPWLSQIARAYDLYRFKRLTFEYVPSVPSTTPGQIVMALDYDVKDANLATTPEVLQSYAGAVTSQVYVPSIVQFDGERTVLKDHKYFCSTSTVPDRLNDVATLIVHLTVPPGTANDTVYGSLFANYDIDFYDPEVSGTTLSDAALLMRSVLGNTTDAADNEHLLGDLITDTIRAQLGDFMGTHTRYSTAQTIGGYVQLGIGIWNILHALRLVVVHPHFLSDEWSRTNGNNTVTTGLRYTDVPAGTDVWVVPAGVSDFMVVWQLQGVWTPVAAAAPTVRFNYSNCTMLATYSIPLYNNSVRYQSSGQDITFGFRLFHKVEDRIAAFSMTMDAADGAWSGVRANWSQIKVFVCPSVDMGTTYED